MLIPHAFKAFKRQISLLFTLSTVPETWADHNRVNESLYKATHAKYGDDDETSQTNNTHLCCFCSKLVNIMLTCLQDGQPSVKEFASWAITGAADTNNGYHYTHSVLIHDTFWPKQYFLQKMSQPAGHDTGLNSFNDSWIWFNPWSSRFFTQ